MKRVIKIICVVLVLGLTLSGCPNPILEARRPDYQLMSTWVSDDETIQFDVLDEWSRVEEETVGGRTVSAICGGVRILGTMAINEEIVTFCAAFDVNDMSIYPAEYVEASSRSDVIYETLECSYRSKRHFVAYVTDGTYLEEGQKIHFYRISPE